MPRVAKGLGLFAVIAAYESRRRREAMRLFQVLAACLFLSVGSSAIAAEDFAFLRVPDTRGGFSVSLNADGTTAYVVTGSNDELIAIDTATLSAGDSVNLNTEEAGQFCLCNLALSPDGTIAYIVEEFSGVILVDLEDFSVIETFVLTTDGARVAIRGIAVSTDGTKLYVVRGIIDAEVLVVDAVSGEIDNTIPVGESGFRIRITPDGTHAYVTGFRRDEPVYVLDLIDEVVESTISTAATNFDVAFTPDGDFAIVSDKDGGLSRIDVTTATVEERVVIGESLAGIAVHPDGTTLLVGSINLPELFVVEVESFDILQTLVVGHTVRAVEFTPDGHAFLAISNENTTVVLPTSELPLPTLQYSLSPSRSDTLALDGATVVGEIFPFLAPEFPEDDITRVQFWIDDPEMTGFPSQTENNAPYDAAGGSALKANALDTSTLDDGVHTLTALLELSDSSEIILESSFRIRNTSHPAEDLTQEEVDLLKQILPHIQFIEEDDGAGGTTKTIRFTGVNIEVEGGTITEL